MKILKLILFFIALFFTLPTYAQFYLDAGEKGSLHWYKLESTHYKIIYPQGLDSLATIYAKNLEQYWAIVGNSVGYKPGEFYSTKTPIIIHAYNASPNGSVVWAPRRMNIYSVPQAYAPGPMPWVQNLAVHESRHLCQMQFGKANTLKPMNYLLGQMFTGAMTAVFPNMHLLEGDAVVAETGLTNFGRGRSSDFLNFYMSSFGSGDYRNWYRWRYGKYGGWVPDHYALGYLTIAGARYCFDDALFMQKYFNRVSSKPWSVFNLQKSIKQSSGLSFNKGFLKICKEFNNIWEQDAIARKPFMQYKNVSPYSKWFTTYTSPIILQDTMLVIKNSSVEASKLVNLKEGKAITIKSFANSVGTLTYEDGWLWWSETIPNIRWGMKENSVLRCMNIRSGKTINFTQEGRYFNPSIYNGYLVAVDYPINTKTRINIFNIQKTEKGIPVQGKHIIVEVPDTMQVVQAGLSNTSLVFTAISNKGFGLYSLPINVQNCPLIINNIGNKLQQLISPLPITMADLAVQEDNIYFSADRTGVNEFYVYNNNKIKQLTSLKYGGKEFVFDEDCSALYFTTLSKQGNLLYKADSLLNKEVNFYDIYKYKVADKLTLQEKTLAHQAGLVWADSVDYSTIKLSTPSKYSKLLNIPNFHSWAPVYIPYDNISSISFDNALSTASIGAMAFFQSDLSNAYGCIGYKWGKSLDGKGYRSSVHFDFTYKGFYPVINIKLDYGERAGLNYYYNLLVDKTKKAVKIVKAPGGENNLFRGQVKTYIPLSRYYGGWTRGCIPSISYYFDNDKFNNGEAIVKSKQENNQTIYSVQGYNIGNSYFNQNISLSVRAFVIRNGASALVYPKYGLGLELGYKNHLNLCNIFSNSVYAYTYGYLPGIRANQGLKITATAQFNLNKNAYIYYNNNNIATPRGYTMDIVNSYMLSKRCSSQYALNLDYSIPFSLGDISILSPLLYIQNFELRPYMDYAYLKCKYGIDSGSLYSIGTEFNVVSANFLWIPFPTNLGVSISYNGGGLYPAFKNMSQDRYFVGLVFRVDM